MRSPTLSSWSISLDVWNSCTVPSDVRIVTLPSCLLTFTTWPSTVGGNRTGSQLVDLTSASAAPLHSVAVATTTAAICLHGLITHFSSMYTSNAQLAHHSPNDDRFARRICVQSLSDLFSQLG